jgi:hypothetical protein
MKQLDIAAAVVFGPVVLSADNTPAALSAALYDAETFLINVGVGGITFDGTNKIEVKLTHSDDDVTYTAVTDADVEIVTEAGAAGTVATGGIVLNLVAAHAAAGVTKVDYIGGKKFKKILADFSGTHGTGTPFCVTHLKGNPKYGPA